MTDHSKAAAQTLVVAVVRGAGRGIGREIALEQARRGARVAVLARTSSQIEETAEPIRD